MFKKANWKEPIDKQDLLYVIFNGIIAGILAGALAGSADYLLAITNFQLSVGLIVLVLVIHWRIKTAFYNNHILYAVLALVFLLFGLFVAYTTQYLIVGIIAQVNPLYIFLDPKFYLYFIIGDFMQIYEGIVISEGLYIIGGILNILVTALAFYYTYRSVRSKR